MIRGRETLSIPRACQLLQVSRRTIYNWMKTGKVEWIRTPGGSPRLFVDTLWKPATPASPKP